MENVITAFLRWVRDMPCLVGKRPFSTSIEWTFCS